MKEINKIGAFTKMCCTIGNLPTSYMVSMTYEEQLLWLCNYLEKTIIPAVNGNAEAVEELQNQFTILKDYVDNYFEDLDIQTEINNKLDEMADSGELTDIIAQYLQLAGILAFNTASDLANAENLSEGSFTKIYGRTTYNDGYGAFYKVRTLINTDVIDGDELIALVNYPTLVAEKMHDQIIDNIQIDLAKTNIELNLYKDKNLVVFGDSWSEPGIPNSEDEYWVKQVESALDMNRFNFAKAGAGFSRTGNKMESQLETAQNQMTTSEKNNTAVVIIFAGDNDLLNGVNDDTILTDAVSLISDCHTTFPNAKIVVAPFEWAFSGLTQEYNTRICNLIGRIDRQTCFLPVVVLKLVRYWLYGIKSYYRNQSHPSVNGYKVIAGMFVNAILGGPEHIEDAGLITPSSGTSYNCSYIMEDGNVTILYDSAFTDSLNDYSGTIFQLPAIATPGVSIVAPLYKAGDGSQVGSILIDDDGTCYLKHVTLTSGTHFYMLPVTFKCSTNVTWSE